MNVNICQLNRLGNREKNEDRLVVAESDNAILLAVADGMGGHRGGEIAAQVLVDTLEMYFRRASGTIDRPREFLQYAIEAAHFDINKRARNDDTIDPRTTCVVCLITPAGATWAHVGDSRLYLLRGSKILSRTIDHSYVEDLYKQGLISEDDMLTHPKRSFLTQCIGGKNKKPHISFSSYKDLQANDVFLLCSDGLWSAIDETRLRMLAAQPFLDTAINEMATTAEKNAYPLSDNISAIVARLQEKPAFTPVAKPSIPKPRRRTEAPPLDVAIEDINQALQDYLDEMDYDAGNKKD